MDLGCPKIARQGMGRSSHLQPHFWQIDKNLGPAETTFGVRGVCPKKKDFRKHVSRLVCKSQLSLRVSAPLPPLPPHLLILPLPSGWPRRRCPSLVPRPSTFLLRPSSASLIISRSSITPASSPPVIQHAEFNIIQPKSAQMSAPSFWHVRLLLDAVPCTTWAQHRIDFQWATWNRQSRSAFSRRSTPVEKDMPVRIVSPGGKFHTGGVPCDVKTPSSACGRP